MLAIKWLVIASGFLILAGVAAVIIGQSREGSEADRLIERLLQSGAGLADRSVAFSSFSELPPPVARYFRNVLRDGQQAIKVVTMHQAGELRTSITATNWLSFTATQFVVPQAPGFVWNARVAMPLGIHLRVLDSYASGIGSGRVSLLSAFAVASESGVPELNSGALHRYLAEAVWYPTALLPQAGILWTPINHRAALATLTDRGVTVSLEFRFNEAGEVTGVYSPHRFGQFDGSYRQIPWKGYFRNYEMRSGMYVPIYGEVGWYDDGTWQVVWKGRLVDVRYEFSP
jgi:hypothetical protein